MNDCPSTEFIERYRCGDLLDPEQEELFEAHLLTCRDCRRLLHAESRQAAALLASQITPSPAHSRHLSDADMIAFVRHEVDPDERIWIEEHLANCRRCTSDVADLAKLHERVETETPDPKIDALNRPALWERSIHALQTFGQKSTRLIGMAVDWWKNLSINGRLIVAILFGIVTGLILRDRAADLQELGSIFLRVLELLATLYIFVAIVHTLLRTEVTELTARRLIYFAFSNTLAAVLIGLLVGNVVQPGIHWNVIAVDRNAETLRTVIGQPSTKVVESLLNNALLVVVSLGVAFGITLRKARQEQMDAGKKDYVVVQALLATIYRSLTLMLNAIVVLFPLAVFAVVAAQVGQQQWRTFQALLGFSATVLIALGLHVSFYLLRLWFGASVHPVEFLRQSREAILTAFSTASSAVTLPLTYRTLRDKVKVRVRAAGLGVLVGGQFNRDGTALYEAITPVFIAQALGHPLPLSQQLLIVGMAVIASIAAPGMPNAGLVTMVLVFRAVDLPAQYILLLPAVDWFLDRCRTAVNVMGTMTVACLLDRRTPANDPHADAGDHYEEPIEPEILD